LRLYSNNSRAVLFIYLYYTPLKIKEITLITLDNRAEGNQEIKKKQAEPTL
jgi:hypothetical protein